MKRSIESAFTPTPGTFVSVHMFDCGAYVAREGVLLVKGWWGWESVGCDRLCV